MRTKLSLERDVIDMWTMISALCERVEKSEVILVKLYDRVAVLEAKNEKIHDRDKDHEGVKVGESDGRIPASCVLRRRQQSPS